MSVGGVGRGRGEGSSRRTPGRRRTGRRRAPGPGCDGARAEVRQDLVDHRRVGNDRDDPHGPLAARADVFDYIERFYNPARRHSTLGYVSPIRYELQAEVA